MAINSDINVLPDTFAHLVTLAAILMLFLA